MKKSLFLLSLLLLAACTNKTRQSDTSPITGTWKLLTGTLIENGDTVVTDYTQNVSFIKIINDNHFAFLHHDLNHGQDSTTAVFVAGGGAYTLNDSLYTEFLEYCNDRAWEGHDFSFTVSVRNDMLTQKGMEVIEDEGVNRLNIEIYKRIK